MTHRPIPKSKGMVSLDTECTGVDLAHGCRPFLVATCDEDEKFTTWEWDVDPRTRLPLITKSAVQEIKAHLANRRIVFHHSKFDVRALETIGITVSWSCVEDTLPKHHVLCSSQSHGLKDLGIEYLDISDEDQQELRDCVNDCRRQAKSLGWRLAAPFDPHFPSMKRAPKDGWWVMDMWLPRAIAKHFKLPKDHPYWTICRKYNHLDCVRTFGCEMLFANGLKEEKREHLYHIRQKLQPITYQMESNGVTVSLKRLQEAKVEFQALGSSYEGKAKSLSFGVLDNIDSDAQIREVLYSKYKLKPPAYTPPSKVYPEGLPKVDQKAVEVLMADLPFDSKPYKFLDTLGRAKKNFKAVGDLEDYERRGIPLEFKSGKQREIFLLLHGNFNTTGTDTTRFSSSGPNLQNISKKEDRKTGEDYNIRRVFGPAPGREWYSIDYSNIELRIFAYASGDEQLIQAFESGYSVHLIVAQVLYPNEWAELRKQVKFKTSSAETLKLAQSKGLTINDLIDREAGKLFKKTYESTLYQWVKNGNFALIYGAGVKKADKTFHVLGAYHTIRKRFPHIDSFMREKNAEAEQYGGVTCLGFLNVCDYPDPDTRPSGYFLEVPHDRPHVAVNYFVQGSAGWCMTMAMIRVQMYLDDLNKSLGLSGRDAYYMNLTVHDELDFDFPIHPRNKKVINDIGRLMELSGNDIGIPTPVEIELHARNWAEGELVAAT